MFKVVILYDIDWAEKIVRSLFWFSDLRKVVVS